MKKCIFHVPNYINPNRKSGSQIRPMKMYYAFQELGYDVDVVMGYGKKRRLQIQMIKKKISEGVHYDFLYSESSTMPTLLTEKHHLPVHPFLDFGFFKFCREHGIPIGLFYRDIYWLFPMYDKTVSFLKSVVAKRFYRYDVRQYAKLLDILYLPSEEMKKHIPGIEHLRSEALPPAMDDVGTLPARSESENSTLQIFYVGGLGENYNLEMIFRVVSENEFLKFQVCCREEEWKQNLPIYGKYLNERIEVIHASGEELNPYLDAADVANIFIKPAEYWTFAMPVKLFEYMQHLCPVVATKGTEVAKFVAEHDIGWVVDYDYDELVKTLAHIAANRAEIVEKSNNMVPILERHTWKARAEKVIDDLTGLVER